MEREEFLNVGIVLYCKERRFLKTKYGINKKRLDALCDQMDCDEVEEHLQSFEKISAGDKAGGQMAEMDIASRFRWLTATRSTIIQTSKVHPGFCEDPKATMEKLYIQFVM